MQFKLITFYIVSLLFTIGFNAQQKISLKDNFDKIIVSPHIEAVLVKGSQPNIVVEDINVPIEKFKYEIIKGTLQVYLEGAKTYTKNKKVVHKDYVKKIPLYNNKVAKVIITYADVNIFSLRGEEKITFKSPLVQKECKLRIYGKSEVTINSINVDNLNVSIYGESFLSIEQGAIKKQRIIGYGASIVNAADVMSKETKVVAYGDGSYQLNASHKIKVTSYGEATILYKGKGKLKKGIVIGESNIKRVQ